MNSINWDMVSAIGQASAAILTILGLYFLVLQIRAGTNVARADFILRLESEFQEHYSEVFQNFLLEGKWTPEQSGPINISEKIQLEHYIGFFANIQIIREDNLINLDTIDKMFAYRFFIVSNSPHTRRIIEPNKMYWELFYQLYNDWLAFRVKKRKSTPNQEFSDWLHNI